jgi:hypothetical protein
VVNVRRGSYAARHKKTPRAGRQRGVNIQRKLSKTSWRLHPEGMLRATSANRANQRL